MNALYVNALKSSLFTGTPFALPVVRKPKRRKDYEK